MMEHPIEIFHSGTLPTQDLNCCVDLLDKGGAVDPLSARAELPHASLIAIRRDGSVIAGVGAIKQKRSWYAANVSKKSGFKLDGDWHELGYVVTAPTHPNLGISKAITAKLLAEFISRPVFATTSSPYMKRTLEQAGFQQKGGEWLGQQGQLSLWLLM